MRGAPAHGPVKEIPSADRCVLVACACMELCRKLPGYEAENKRDMWCSLVLSGWPWGALSMVPLNKFHPLADQAYCVFKELRVLAWAFPGEWDSMERATRQECNIYWHFPDGCEVLNRWFR